MNGNTTLDENYSILVNSSDGFEDCWGPFFTMFRKFWPKCTAPVYLNTETKVWQFPNFNIQCTTVQGNQQRRLTWSECLISALDQIKTPFVLYLQEDYFIHQPVRTEVISTAVQQMLAHPEIKHIALSRHGSMAPYEPSHFEGLLKIRQKAKYRISTQAALWRVETLKSYLRPEENGWMFEIYGTFRAQRRQECFLCANFDISKGGPAIEYLHTGIIKGKWLAEMPAVFAANNIEIDYSKRGFYKPKPYLFNKFEVLKKLLERPSNLIRQLFLP